MFPRTLVDHLLSQYQRPLKPYASRDTNLFNTANMPKAEVGSTKYLANKMKMKGGYITLWRLSSLTCSLTSNQVCKGYAGTVKFAKSSAVTRTGSSNTQCKSEALSTRSHVLTSTPGLKDMSEQLVWLVRRPGSEDLPFSETFANHYSLLQAKTQNASSRTTVGSSNEISCNY